VSTNGKAYTRPYTYGKKKKKTKGGIRTIKNRGRSQKRNEKKTAYLIRKERNGGPSRGGFQWDEISGNKKT